ncbi:MAG: transposase [Flavobacteriales bacterium]|nr:transposase [Flavobacteriales bacterium]
MQRKNKLAQSVSGIRPVLVSELIAHTAGFTRFDPPRQLVCSVGAAPFERTSGSSVRERPPPPPCQPPPQEPFQAGRAGRRSCSRRPYRLLPTQACARQTAHRRPEQCGWQDHPPPLGCAPLGPTLSASLAHVIVIGVAPP